MAPKRTRSHQLENESIMALESAIPTEWLYRRLSQDYGIDGEVEIFNGENATALKFLVQLKATDEKNLSKALSITLPLDKCDYYFRHTLPVLICRYHSPSKHLFVKWFHSFDPYYCRSPKSKNAKITLDVECKWTAQTPCILLEELTAFQSIRSPSLPKPLPFDLVIDSETIAGLTRFQISSLLRESLQPVQGLISIKKLQGVTKATNVIHLSESRITITLAGQNGCTLHGVENYPVKDASDTLPVDIFLAIGIALHHHGHSNLGAAIASEFNGRGLLTKNTEVVLHLASCFSAGNKFHRAAEIAESLFEIEEFRINAQYLMQSVLLHSRERFSKSERVNVSSILARMAEKVESSDPALSSALHYSHANFLVFDKSYLKALKYYKKASRIYKDYLTREYYWREIGGLLFECGHFSRAVKAYACAVQLGSNHPKILGAYAESLFYTGEYKRAEETFALYFIDREPDPSDALLYLSHFASRHLQIFLKIDKQNRRPKEAREIFLDKKEFTEEDYLNVLSHDGLCPFVWYNIGQFRLEKGDRNSALFAFLMASLLFPQDVESWQNFLSLANEYDENLFYAGVVSAYLVNGETFSRFYIEKLTTPESLKAAEDLFSELATILKPDKSKTIRFHRVEGGYDIVRSNESE